MSNLRYPVSLARSIVYRRAKGKKNNTVFRLFILITLLMVPLILSLSFTEGMIEGITKKYVLLQDGHIQIYKDIASMGDLSEVDGVAHADETVHGYGILYSSDETKEIYLKGVDESYFNGERKKELGIGELAPLERNGALPGIYISRALAEYFSITVSDRLALVILPEYGQRKVRPALAVVQGIFDTGFYALDESIVFIDSESASILLPSGNIQSEIIFDSYSQETAAGFMHEVEDAVGESLTWAGYDEFNTDMYENFTTSRQIIFIVFITILIAAVFYITAVTHELIEDAKEEIAMQKVLGARSVSIMSAYVLAITIVTLCAIAAGTALGIALSQNLSPFMTFLKSYDLSALRYYLLDFDIAIPYAKIVSLVSILLVMSIISVLLSLRHIIHIRALDVLQQD